MAETDAGPSPGGEEADRPLPRWTQYAAILGRPLGAISAATIAVILGGFGQRVIQSQQNAQVYTQLLSQRAEAESNMRMSMFGTTLTQVLQTDPANASISDQLLRLELLALNFSETLSLSPLFNDMDRKISQNDTESRGRLETLAKRVTGWQLSRLAAQGESYRIDVPLAQIESRFGYTHDFGLELKGVSRELRLTLSNPDRVLQTVDVNIDIVTDQPTSPAEARMIVRAFTLSYYDFPLIDNTRLSRDQRLAVVLVDYHENDECPIAEMETIACYRATLEVVVFPGSVATQREAPTLQEVVNNLDSLLVDPTPQ